jgi:hypothetical protein
MPCNLSSLLIPRIRESSVPFSFVARQFSAAARIIRASVAQRRDSMRIPRGTRPRQQSQVSEAK